jgi:hypothetical protein
VPDVPPVPLIPPVPEPFLSGGSSWFSERESDVSPDALLSDVRDAIIAGLAAHSGTLDHLGDDDTVVVAVDFLPRMPDRSPVRTMVARAKKKDVAAARGGRLAIADLRARVVFDEY